MKKLIGIGLSLCAFCAFADENRSMMFTMNNGEEKFISSNNLVISFSGENLTATNGTETLTLPLVNVQSMQFSSEAGVSDIFSDSAQPLKVYTLEGIYLGKFEKFSDLEESADKGIYVCKKSDGASFKILVKWKNIF